jgi:hypothetical protein
MIYDRLMPARVPASQGVPDVQYLQHTSGYAGILGSVLIYSAGEVTIAADNVTTGIVGVGLAAANSAPGFNAQNNPLVFTGRQRKIPVAKANRQTVFWAYLVNGNDTKINPVLADIGGNYGLRLTASGIWAVDKARTTAVRVIDVDLTWNGIFFKFQEGALANP